MNSRPTMAIAAIILATGFSLAPAQEASAHPNHRHVAVKPVAHSTDYYERNVAIDRKYRRDYRDSELRHKKMPRWLKRNKGFRHWYRYSPYKRYRQMSWHDIYEVYRWQSDYWRQVRRHRR